MSSMDIEFDDVDLKQVNDAVLERMRQQTAQQLQRIETELQERRRRATTTTKVKAKANETTETELSNAAISRYSRHLLLPDFGVEKQLRLLNASFLIVGCGGLGCPAAQYLASCGAGTLGLVDYDHVEESNLHRQVLHRQDAVGVNKAISIKRAVTGGCVRACVQFSYQRQSFNLIHSAFIYHILLVRRFEFLRQCSGS